MPALVFHLDHTLVDLDTHIDYSAALDQIGPILRRPPEVVAPEAESDARKITEILAVLAGDPRWQEVSDLVERQELAGLESSIPLAGLDELTAVIEEENAAVVSDLGPNATREALDRHRIPIRTMVSRDPRLDPEPAPHRILEACRLLQVDPADVLVFGGSGRQRDAAAAAGSRFVAIAGRSSAFAEDDDTVEDLAEAVGRIRA